MWGIQIIPLNNDITESVKPANVAFLTSALISPLRSCRSISDKYHMTGSVNSNQTAPREQPAIVVLHGLERHQFLMVSTMRNG